MRYRKKPVIIDAFQFMGHDTGLEPDWFVEAVNAGKIVRNRTEKIEGSDWLEIKTLEGSMVANRRNWIIRGIKGEIYSCQPDIFEQSYEAVDETET